MPSQNSAHLNQRGFTLIEVLSAAMVLSIFILAIGACWTVTDQQVNRLVMRQKAIFAADAEMERLSVLYDTTTFGVLGAVTTTGYSETPAFPSTRLVYPSPLTPYSGGPASDFTTTSATTFQSGNTFQVYIAAQLLSPANRAFLWVDQNQGVMARVSWTVTNITPSACLVGGDGCACLGYLGLLGGSCQKLVLYLEYPYRLTGGAPVASSNLQTVSLATIVGRHT